MEQILRREVGARTQLTDTILRIKHDKLVYLSTMREHPRTMELHRLVARVHNSYYFGSFSEDKLYMTVENNHRFVTWWKRHPDDWVCTYYVTFYM